MDYDGYLDHNGYQGDHNEDYQILCSMQRNHVIRGPHELLA